MKVTAKGSGRISLAGLTCYRPGQRSRLIYRAMVHKGHKGEKKGIREADFAALVDAAHQQLAGLAAFDGLQWRMTAAYQVMRPSGHKGPASVVTAAALAVVDPCAMVVCHPGWTSTKVIAVLTEAGFDATRLALHYAGPQFVEVTAAPVDKATGVLRAIQRIGVTPQRVIAFGDMPIDIAMFSVVGHSVAMGNAPDEVWTAATSQTASVEDDGFARMLSHLDLVPRGLVAPMPVSSEPPALREPGPPGQAVVDRR